MNTELHNLPSTQIMSPNSHKALCNESYSYYPQITDKATKVQRDESLDWSSFINRKIQDSNLDLFLTLKPVLRCS